MESTVSTVRRTLINFVQNDFFVGTFFVAPKIINLMNSDDSNSEGQGVILKKSNDIEGFRMDILASSKVF